MNLEVITQYSKSPTWTYGTTKMKIPETELENEILKTDKHNLKLPT